MRPGSYFNLTDHLLQCGANVRKAESMQSNSEPLDYAAHLENVGDESK
jgi:hypothetical protein